MCTWNGTRHLEEQLSSILSQSRPPDELVVRDDLSSDGTADAVRQILSDAPFPCRVATNPENLGSTRNFEAAIRDCEGDVVLLSDQDDVWERDKIATIAERFQSPRPPAFVFSNASLIDAHGRPLPGDLWKRVGFTPARRRDFQRGNQFEQLLRNAFVTGCTAAFRREDALRAMPFGPTWVHDLWLTLRIVSRGGIGEAVDRPLIRYRVHPAQQIGVAVPNPSKRSEAERYLLEADLWRAFAAGLPDSAIAPRVRTLLEEKIAHFHFRAAMRATPLPARWWKMIPEIAHNRYRFDFSRLAWLRDLVGK